MPHWYIIASLAFVLGACAGSVIGFMQGRKDGAAYDALALRRTLEVARVVWMRCDRVTAKNRTVPPIKVYEELGNAAQELQDAIRELLERHRAAEHRDSRGRS